VSPEHRYADVPIERAERIMLAALKEAVSPFGVAEAPIARVGLPNSRLLQLVGCPRRLLARLEHLWQRREAARAPRFGRVLNNLRLFERGVLGYLHSAIGPRKPPRRRRCRS
jgi:hypothetical protein